jgi:putative phage-type endonuclease
VTLDRTKSIGGSDVAAILGLSPWRTPLDVWREKALGQLDDKSSDAMEAGLRFEDPILMRFLDDHVETSQRQAAITRKAPVVVGHRHASPDALLVQQGWQSLVEVKTTSSGEGWGLDGSSEIPAHYLPQVMHYLDVLELDDAYVPVLVWPSDMRRIAGLTPAETIRAVGLRTYRVHYNQALAAQIRDVVAEFWERHVVAMKPPEPRDLADAKRCAWAVAGKTVEADDELVELLEAREHYRTVIDDTEKLVEQAEMQIRAKLGDAESALGAGGKAIVSAKVINRAGYTAQVKATSYRGLTVPKNWRNYL